MDGASEWRIFTRIALPMMMPGLVTVFLFQFVAVWNNFLLPYIMLSDDEKFPITLGLFTLLEQGANTPALYTLVITGALLAVIPLIALFLVIQRFWSLDLLLRSRKVMTMSRHRGQAHDRRPSTTWRARRASHGAPSRACSTAATTSARPPAEAVNAAIRKTGYVVNRHARSPDHRTLRLDRLPADGAAGEVLRGPQLQRPAARLHPGARRARHPAAADDGRHGGRTAPASPGTSPRATSTACCWSPATPATRSPRSCARRACPLVAAASRSGAAPR